MKIRRIGWTIGLTLVTASANAGTTPVENVIYSPDITLDLAGHLTADENAAIDDLMGTVALQDIGAIPSNADLAVFHQYENGDQLLAFDITIELPGPVIARPSDVVRRTPGGDYSFAFDGSVEGVPDGARVDAVSVDGNDLLLSFDTTVALGGITAADEDVVTFDGASFTLHFDGSAAGIPQSADLDALHFATDTGLMYVSFDIGGTVGGVSFSDEDLLTFDPGAASWALAYDGSAEHLAWNAGDLDAAWVMFLAGFLFQDGFEDL